MLRWLMLWEGCQKPPEDPQHVLWGWGGQRDPQPVPWFSYHPARAGSSLSMGMLTGTGGG